MKSNRLAAVVASVILFSVSPSVAGAASVPCGRLYATTYQPVVSNCGDWLISRFPDRPTLRDGRWVIDDNGQEFTLMFNSGTTEWASKDDAMLWSRDHNVQVRFGAAQPMDGSEPTQEYLQQHLGLYVESEYVGDWVRDGLPREQR